MMLLNDEDEIKRGIVLMRIEGYSFYEIAMKYKISESSARVIDFRIKKRIRKILEKEGLSNV
jgi:RNA polymerase sigma-70 factor (ECF subfamily)